MHTPVLHIEKPNSGISGFLKRTLAITTFLFFRGFACADP
jgi:hypothetical protein